MSDFNPIYGTGSDATANSDIVDLELPSIPEAPVEEKIEVKDRDPVGFKFGFIGAGQGGGKIAESFHQAGYARVGVINTADQDLASVNVPHKFKFGEQQGAGKDRSVARKAFVNQREDVVDFIKASIGEDVDRIFVTVGAGGGTGAGVCSELVKTVKAYQDTIKASSQKVGLILALPKLSEGKKVSSNAYETLKEACELVQQKVVSPLIILDNEKINDLYPKLPINKFWQVANANITSLFHLFNNIVTKSSQYTTFDTNDYKTVLDSGIMVFGAMNINNVETEQALSKAVRENLKRNVLCGDLDLSTGTVAAAIAIGDQQTLDKIPQEHIDNAFNQLNRTLKTNSTVHQGIYKGVKSGLSVFTAIGGIAAPIEKIKALQKMANSGNDLSSSGLSGNVQGSDLTQNKQV
jgi:cell division GTPase FtsZ